MMRIAGLILLAILLAFICGLFSYAPITDFAAQNVLTTFNVVDGTTARRAVDLQFGITLPATVTETYREFTDAEGEVTRDRSPASLENSTHYGAVLGAGLRARSSGRIALMPGLRFTRWFSPTIVDGPTRSTKNQVEFLLSITF